MSDPDAMPREVITTIVTPTATHDMTTLSDVRDDWGVTDTDDDAFLSRAITRCSRAAEQFCNRTLALETLQDQIFLRRDGWPRMIVERPDVLQLSRWPLVTITSVTLDGTARVEGTDFIKDAHNGQLQRINVYGSPIPWEGLSIVAIYSAGFVLPGQPSVTGADELPDDVQDAISRMVYTRYAERQRDPLVKSEYVDGVGRTEYLTPNADGNLSADIADILENYRVPVVG